MNTEQLIWREVEVPISSTLKVLHDIVQITMGWYDQHLWEFTIGKKSYGLRWTRTGASHHVSRP